jgi:hypothetical protein
MAVVAGDLNGDGKPDLAVANMGDLNDGGSDSGSDSGSVSILLGSGGGAFGAASNISAGTSPLHVSLADFNGDGKLDLAVLDNGLLYQSD